MFDDVSAWFSSSVDRQSKQLWKDHGGYESDFDKADFIFSADNTSQDTLRVFNSAAYIIEHLEVFHSRYITDCVKAGNRSDIVLGRYILPPQDILNDVKKHTTLCWDIPGPQNQTSRPNNRNVIIHPPPRSPGSKNQRVPHPGGQPQTNTQAVFSQPHRTGTIPARQPHNAATRHTTSASSSQQRSHEQASNLQGTQLCERRSTQPVDRTSGSLSKQPERPERQINEQRRASSRQQNQTSSAAPAEQTAGQKRAAEAPTAATHSPRKRRNTAQGGDGGTGGTLPPAQQSHGSRTRRETPANSSDSQRQTAKENHNAVRREGLMAATSTTSPRQQQDTEVRRKKSSHTITVFADVHGAHTNSSAWNPQRGVGRCGGDVLQRGQLSEPTEKGVYHISQLMKVMAQDLTDFIPKKDGAEVYHRSVP
ncbi:uncharacterized protein LOC143282524 [Babylonia areolata]|uniref:uncharacterized protein LOC143282524 n=1 Tax=Babylonia areolata TaxID=304850 RepID=UPI003FD1E432